MGATPSFEPLAILFRGDFDRIQNCLSIFERMTREDLERMDRAYAGRDWVTLGRLAHKMRSGCHQIGEIDAAMKLATIERAASLELATEELAREYALACEELGRVMSRVHAYLATGNSGAS